MKLRVIFLLFSRYHLLHQDWKCATWRSSSQSSITAITMSSNGCVTSVAVVSMRPAANSSPSVRRGERRRRINGWDEQRTKRMELFIVSLSPPFLNFLYGALFTLKKSTKGNPKRTSKTSWIQANVPFRIKRIVYLQWWKLFILMNTLQNFTCYEM